MSIEFEVCQSCGCGAKDLASNLSRHGIVDFFPFSRLLPEYMTGTPILR